MDLFNNHDSNHDCHNIFVCPNCENFFPIVKMKLRSVGINKGIIDPQYGAASNDKLGAMPLESIPFNWSNIPYGTKYYAITIVDYDTVPIMGFPWIHWLIANIPAKVNSLPANASILFKKNLTQGVTSYANGYPLDLTNLAGFQVNRTDAFQYGGMVPVNFPHKYTMTVYALDKKLNLTNGFPYNDLLDEMNGHILGMGILYGIYNAKITYL